MKKQLGVNDIFFPVPPALIVCGQKEANIITVSWTGMVSSIPPMLSISIHKNRFSLNLIRKYNEFTLNIPSIEMLKEVDYCGSTSGNNINKWKETGLEKGKSLKIMTPIIEDAPFNFECKVIEEKTFGEYVTFFAEIQEIHIDEDKMSDTNRAGVDVDKINPIIYFATIREYRKVGEKIGEAFKEWQKLEEDKKGSLEYFNEVATEWDKMRKNFFPDEIRKIAVKKANVNVGDVAADIGAGAGFISEELIKNGVKVIAVDQSEEMIKILKNKFADITAVQGDSDLLPIPDESVNFSFANMYLHHVENPANAIKEMVRILKPNGKLIITDLDSHNHEFLRTEQYDKWMGFDRNEIKKWFENAGLKNVEIDCCGENCCADSKCGCTSAEISIFIAYGEKI